MFSPTSPTSPTSAPSSPVADSLKRLEDNLNYWAFGITPDKSTSNLDSEPSTTNDEATLKPYPDSEPPGSERGEARGVVYKALRRLHTLAVIAQDDFNARNKGEGENNVPSYSIKLFKILRTVTKEAEPGSKKAKDPDYKSDSPFFGETLTKFGKDNYLTNTDFLPGGGHNELTIVSVQTIIDDLAALEEWAIDTDENDPDYGDVQQANGDREELRRDGLLQTAKGCSVTGLEGVNYGKDFKAVKNLAELKTALETCKKKLEGIEVQAKAHKPNGEVDIEALTKLANDGNGAAKELLSKHEGEEIILIV